MGKRSAFVRRERDAYDTPLSAVLPLFPHLPRRASYVEPCAGTGDLVRHLSTRGHECVFARDIAPRGQAVARAGAVVHRQSALDIGWAARCADLIITNPPWDRAWLHRMIAHFAALRPSWLLFDADWCHTRQAAPFLPMLRKIVSVGRVKWVEGSAHTGKDNCAWHLFSATGRGCRFVGRMS